MLKRIKSKKGQIGQTLTWIVAFLLIFFIMFLFTLWCTLIAVGKGFSGKDYKAGEIADLERNSQALIKILDTKVEGKETLYDQILESLDIYILQRGDSLPYNVFSGASGSNGDLNYVWRIDREYLIQSLELRNKSISDIDKADIELIASVRKIFDPLCSKYMLKIPQGFINEGKYGFYVGDERENIFTDNLRINKENFPEWGETHSMLVQYKGLGIEIKYRMLASCEND